MTDFTSSSEYPEDLKKLMRERVAKWLGLDEYEEDLHKIEFNPSSVALECKNTKCPCKERLKKNKGLKRKEMGFK